MTFIDEKLNELMRWYGKAFSNSTYKTMMLKTDYAELENLLRSSLEDQRDRFLEMVRGMERKTEEVNGFELGFQKALFDLETQIEKL